MIRKSATLKQDVIPLYATFCLIFSHIRIGLHVQVLNFLSSSTDCLKTKGKSLLRKTRI